MSERVQEQVHTEEEVTMAIKRDAQLSVYFEVEQGAKAPRKAYPTDAGWDLFVWQAVFPTDGKSQVVYDSGVRVLIPEGYVGLVLPRSSAIRAGFDTPVGTIDAGYTGTIKMLSWRDDSAVHPKGTSFAQLVILPLPNIQLKQGNVRGMATARGENGFGSSGVYA